MLPVFTAKMNKLTTATIQNILFYRNVRNLHHRSNVDCIPQSVRCCLCFLMIPQKQQHCNCLNNNFLAYNTQKEEPRFLLLLILAYNY